MADDFVNLPQIPIPCLEWETNSTRQRINKNESIDRCQIDRSFPGYDILDNICVWKKLRMAKVNIPYLFSSLYEVTCIHDK